MFRGIIWTISWKNLSKPIIKNRTRGSENLSRGFFIYDQSNDCDLKSVSQG
jgi:hypothetical protein